MDQAHPERTVVPSGTSLSTLAKLLRTDSDVEIRCVGRAGDDPTGVVVPREVLDVMRDVVSALADGRAVTVSPHARTLRTQEAADLLGISRPTLVRLLEQGAIPYEQPCRHRRIVLDDLLAFQRGSRRRADLRPAPSGWTPTDEA